MRTVLLAINGSGPSQDAADYGRDLFVPAKTRFLAVNVVPMVPDEVKDEIWSFELQTGTRNAFEMESGMMEYPDRLVSRSVLTQISE